MAKAHVTNYEDAAAVIRESPKDAAAILVPLPKRIAALMAAVILALPLTGLLLALLMHTSPGMGVLATLPATALTAFLILKPLRVRLRLRREIRDGRFFDRVIYQDAIRLANRIIDRAALKEEHARARSGSPRDPDGPEQPHPHNERESL